MMSKIFWEMSSTKISKNIEANKIDAEINDPVEVAYLIAKFLKDRGVDRIFGICGGHILPIWDYLNQLGINIIDVRDERIAVHMAQAYSELTGNIGVASVTAGPGLSNAVTGIANAHVSRVPLLVISGIPPRPQKYMNPLQELPQGDIIRPICRYARTITYAGHVLRELDEAFACAKGQGNDPGPSYIDFPTDLLRETLSKDIVDDDLFGQRKEYFSIPDTKVIDAAVEMLWSARKPLLITGRGARGSQQEIIKLLDILNPVYLDTTESRGMVPYDHPNNMPASRGRAMEEADVVIMIGRSMDFQLAYGSRAIFPNTRFIRIGTCAAELRMNRRDMRDCIESFGNDDGKGCWKSLVC
jgi:acetolactate synthase-1/2/3 large subunit